MSQWRTLTFLNCEFFAFEKNVLFLFEKKKKDSNSGYYENDFT